MKLLAWGIQNLKLELKKYVSMSMVKMSKLRITSSVIVTDIPIKPAGSFWVACYRCSDLDLKAVTLKLNCDLDVLKMCLETENEVARSSHSKYIAWMDKVQKYLSRSRSNVTQLQTTSSVPHGTYSYQLMSIFGL